MSFAHGFGDYADGGGYDYGSVAPGGFLNTGNQNSPGERKGKEQSFQTVTPLTLKMILESHQNVSDDSLSVDGKQISKVVVCGRVLSAHMHQTYNEYVLDDGTGVLNIMKSEEEETKGGEETIPENCYICVHGAIRSFEGQRKILAHFLRIIQDHNELNYHSVSVLFNHYQNLKGPLNDGSKLNHTSASTVNPSSGIFNQGIQNSFSSDLGSALDMESKLVHDAFASDMITDTGLTVQTVADRLKTRGFTVQKVRQICQSLMTNGFVYSTVDEDHFKSTGSVI